MEDEQPGYSAHGRLLAGGAFNSSGCSIMNSMAWGLQKNIHHIFKVVSLFYHLKFNFRKKEISKNKVI